MDQAFKENIHNFMLGLEVVLILAGMSIVVLYFVIRYKVKKKKQAEGE